MDMQTQDELLSLRQAAKRLGRSTQVVYRLIDKGLLKPVNEPDPLLERREWQFRASDVDSVRQRAKEVA